MMNEQHSSARPGSAPAASLGPAPLAAAGAPSLPALPAPAPTEHDAFAALLGLVRRLRAPDGCPWDREQTLHTMTPYIIEEAYEVIDAIERNDSRHLGEELGDLLFLLFFCADIGRTEGRFQIEEVLLGHVRKMIARHPHVFANQDALGAGKAAQQWEELKQEEGGGSRSVVDGRLPSLPGLTAAYRVQEKVAAVGFDWEEIAGALDKIEEEIRELRAALGPGRPGGSAGEGPASPGAAEREEIGDLLFSIVNVARRLRIDPEAAIRGTTAKFMRRFRYVEARLAAAGNKPSTVTLAEMDRLWEEAKAREARGEPLTDQAAAG
jgi:MazG family protein